MHAPAAGTISPPGAPVIRAGLALLAAYLVGAIPFGLLLGRLGGVDVRRVGSGNIGATNVLRSRGPAAGLATLGFDASKGAVAVVGAVMIAPGSAWVPAAAGFAAVLGHCYPVYLGFRGGKGVATATGVYLVLSPWAALTTAASALGAIAWSRMVSVGSILGAIAFPIIAGAFGDRLVAFWAIPTAGVILWRHRENLARIRRGRENRIGGSGRRPDEGRSE